MMRKFALLLVLMLLAGCSKSGADRNALSGKVTFKGEPVPFGRIVFTPDMSKGNDGPQGIARVVDGEYHTGKKGAVKGPLIVQIDGYSAIPNAEDEGGGAGRPLFRNWTTKIELAPGDSEFDFEIP